MHLQLCQAAEDIKDVTDCAHQLGEIMESTDRLINPSSDGNMLPTTAASKALKQSQIAVQHHTSVVLLITKHHMSTVIIYVSETQRVC